MSINTEETQLKDTLMISTDLDGTLLDHTTYSWQAATPALLQLNQKKIPVLINTSKTMAEVVNLQKQLQMTSPFIVENGSALYFSKQHYLLAPDSAVEEDDYWVKVFGVPKISIVEEIHQLRLRHKWKFQGFSDWTCDQVSDYTGLDKKSAELALGRGYSEPILWQDTAENFQLFTQAIKALNFSILQGGRFTHILGKTNKGVPLKWLSEIYRHQKFINIKWIVLGDSHNDIDMLQLAEYPVVIKSPVADYPQFTSQRPIIYTQEIGPNGWNTAIQSILQNN